MPFGAELMANGQVRFRLWAPSASRVDVVLENRAGAGERAMAAEADGWFGLTTDAAGTGSRYRFRIDGGDLLVPDPASRFQPDDVHGPSEVVDPAAYGWRDGDWRGRPWEEAVIYELHVGSFTEAGNCDGVRRKLDYLADLGVTAVELMPMADFPGARGWGYDGVALFAPDSSYGRPQDLKRLIDEAHARGLMVLLDVVYNHFGPEGNYLHAYARDFFTDRHATPWGAAINLDGPGSEWVRRFFLHNALYWLEEYHFDGLRLDAVHALTDDSSTHLLDELAESVRGGLPADRQVHLVLENDDNAARYLPRARDGRPRRYTAQWNDDYHHACHVALTGESDGYYGDYADAPVRRLARCLAEGFDYQGEMSPHRDGARRGEPSGQLPPTAFVNFLQNHDQTGNRALGERLAALVEPPPLKAATALLLLAPSPPLLFMGEEWACVQPFLFFCDFEPELAAAVRAGRRAEFGRFPAFSDPAMLERIPDPTAPATFVDSVLDWSRLQAAPHADWLALHRRLLALRREAIGPRLAGMDGGSARVDLHGERAFTVRWRLGDGARLTVAANLGGGPGPRVALPDAPLLYSTHAPPGGGAGLAPWSVTWWLEPAAGSP
jgi:malto-oligosyltrehalose trehalohydrolase